jgi:hypothetical protein
MFLREALLRPPSGAAEKEATLARAGTKSGETTTFPTRRRHHHGGNHHPIRGRPGA